MLSILCLREYLVYVYDIRRVKCILYIKLNMYLENLIKMYNDLYCILIIVFKRFKLVFGFVLLYIVLILWFIDIWIDFFV